MMLYTIPVHMPQVFTIFEVKVQGRLKMSIFGGGGGGGQW